MPNHSRTSNPVRKGERTRRRIMESTKSILETTPYGQIRITAIASASEITQPNFYTYFSSVNDVIFAIAESTNVDRLKPHFEADWNGQDGFERVRQFLQAFLNLWESEKAVFTVTNALADEGDEAFSRLRFRQMHALYVGIEKKVSESQSRGRIHETVNARLVAFECIALLTSVGQRLELFKQSGFSDDDVVDTTARILQQLCCGSEN